MTADMDKSLNLMSAIGGVTTLADAQMAAQALGKRMEELVAASLKKIKPASLVGGTTVTFKKPVAAVGSSSMHPLSSGIVTYVGTETISVLSEDGKYFAKVPVVLIDLVNGQALNDFLTSAA